MKKLFFIFLLVFLVSVPFMVQAAPLVQCGNATPPYNTPCTLADFFQMCLRVFNFMIFVIAVPLAGLLMAYGGVLMIISAGNPGRFEQGKGVIKITVIALCIIFGSWLIINTLLVTVLGYRPQGGGSWWSI